MKRRHPSSKSPSSVIEENIILLDNLKYVCILNCTKKNVIIRQKETPVPINYIDEVFPTIFTHVQYNKSKDKMVSCVWTPSKGYLIKYDRNTYQSIKSRIQNKCSEEPRYFQTLVKRIITSKLRKLDNIYLQHHFQLVNIIEVNNMLWMDQLPQDCEAVCQVPTLSPILTLGNYHIIGMVLDQFMMDLPVQCSFTKHFMQYIIKQNNLKKIIIQTKDLISFLMYFKTGFYKTNSTDITVSDFIWNNHQTVSIIHDNGSIVKNIDFRKVYFIQEKLNILDLMTAAIKILGLFLLGRNISLSQT